MNSSERLSLVRIAAELPIGSEERRSILSKLSSNDAWEFSTTIPLKATVRAGRYEVVEDELQFKGEAILSLVSRTGGVLTAVRGISFSASYNLKGEFFQVKSENDMYAEAITEACIENRERILGSLRKSGQL